MQLTKNVIFGPISIEIWWEASYVWVYMFVWIFQSPGLVVTVIVPETIRKQNKTKKSLQSL